MINPFDESFIREISNDLTGFKKSNHNYNFRCPYCGDSAKSTRKKRGWLIDYQGATFFKCFNCGKSASFKHFLKDIDENVYKRYLVYKNSEKHYAINETNVNSNISNTDIISYNNFINNPNIVSCSKTTSATLYLRKRHIKKLDLFYYTSDYGSLLKSLGLDKYKIEWTEHEERLVIPHWDKGNELTFLQFRDLNPNAKIRYKTYRIKEDTPKIWGLENVDWNKKVYICEGALDASLLDNAIAMSGADVDISNSYINNYKESLYFILDNEPYNKEICNRYKKLSSLGFNVFIWPKTEAKDINDYYLANNNVDVFYDKDRYFNGLKLKLELTRWIKN